MSAVSDVLTRFDWECALHGPAGPSSPTMRHVLLAIAWHVRRPGSVECWPSISTLQKVTGRGRHTVIDNVRKACEMGWLHKESGRAGGMRRPGTIYTLTIPTSATTAPVEPVGNSDRLVQLAQGLVQLEHATSAVGAPGLVQPQHPKLEVEVRREIKKEVELPKPPDKYPERKTQEQGKSVLQENLEGAGSVETPLKGRALYHWATKNRIRPKPRESAMAYRQRIEAEYTKTKPPAQEPAEARLY